jgi:hypothetical protein
MAYEMRPGQGSAFTNDKKVEDWHPDFKGKVLLPNGDMHWLDVTKKVTKDGKEWVSVKVGNKVQAGAPVYSGAHDAAKADGFAPQRAAYAPLNNDDPPF